MTQQFIRKASLIVAPTSKELTGGLDMSQLQLRFSIHQWDLQTPNVARIRVYNVSDQTASQVEKEFTRLILSAGYQDGNFGTIFDGDIIQTRRGRESPTDTFLDILAGDGDQAYNFGFVNTSLAAGSKPADHIDTAAKAMEPSGITRGYTPDLGASGALPRGRVLYGMARDVMRDAARESGTSWSVQNRQLQLTPQDGYVPGDAVVLTAKTGMVGLPEQTIDGIRARCLLNPQLKIGGRVQIDNKSIQKYEIDAAYTAINFVPKIANDGFYRLLVVEHCGDTRGNDWYSNMICIALDDTVPMAQAARGRG